MDELSKRISDRIQSWFDDDEGEDVAIGDAVLAEIGKTHWMVAIGDDKSGKLVRCEYEHDCITFE